MFGFSSAKLAIYGILALAVVSIIGLGYAHYTGLVEDNARLRENAVKLMAAIEIQKSATAAAMGAVDAWKTSAADLGKRIDEMARVQVRAAAQTRRLNDIFAKHDLEALSLAKPRLIERRINSGSASVLRVLECSTGNAAKCPVRSRPANAPAAP